MLKKHLAKLYYLGIENASSGMTITKNQIKHVRALQSKKFRIHYKEFVVEGPKMIRELINSRFLVKDIYSLSTFIDSDPDSFSGFEGELQKITRKELGQISSLTTPNEALAIVEIPQQQTNPVDIGEGLNLILDDIQDPGNLGTIIRTADWFGVKHIICSENSVEVYNPKVVQSTMGSIGRVDVIYTGLKEFLAGKTGKISIYGTFPEGRNIYESEIEGNSMIIIGNESRGVSDELLPYIDMKLSIPHFYPDGEPGAESLNASIATALVCAEFRRRNS